MNLIQCKDFLLESGLISEFALLSGILLIALWMWISPKSAFGMGFWVALLAIGCSYFFSGFTPEDGSFYSLGFNSWTCYLKRYFGISFSVALFGFLEWRNGRQTEARAEIFLILLLSQLSLSLLIQAKELWLLFLCAETFSICSYALAKPGSGSVSGSSAILKYFSAGAFASAIGIFGLSWIVGFQGSILEPNPDFPIDITFFPVAGAVFFISFLFFKLGGFPFHFWVPGVYENAPTPFAGLIASAPKVAAAFALLMVVEKVDANITIPLILLAMVGSILGNLAAFGSTSVKNMLSYAAIGQAGLLVIPAIFSRQISGAQSHLLIFGVGYAVVIQGTFSAVQYFENHLKDQFSIKDLAGQFTGHPLPSMLFFILIVSLVGIPPTIGFSGKLILFSGILGGVTIFSHKVLFLLFGLGLLNTLLSLGYYYKIPFQLIFKGKVMEDHIFRNSSASLFFIVLTSLFAISSFFFPEFFFPI